MASKKGGGGAAAGANVTVPYPAFLPRVCCAKVWCGAVRWCGLRVTDGVCVLIRNATCDRERWVG